VRRSPGTTSKAAAKALEQKWRQQIYDRVKLGKAPAITLGEAAARYYDTILEPGTKPKKLTRDLAHLKQIKDAFGANRKLNEITRAEVAKLQDQGTDGACLDRDNASLRPSLPVEPGSSRCTT
jgi:hypothetical protein